jgi:hypothetical protein
MEVLRRIRGSAGLGRKIALPFRPWGIAKPIDLWKKPELAKAAPLMRLAGAVDIGGPTPRSVVGEDGSIFVARRSPPKREAIRLGWSMRSSAS